MTGSIYELTRQVLVGEAPNPAPEINTTKVNGSLGQLGTMQVMLRTSRDIFIT